MAHAATHANAANAAQAPAHDPPTAAPGAIAPAARQLHALFAERFEWQMREAPEEAMERGDYRFADRIADHSLQAIDRRHRETQEFLARLHAIPKAALSEDDLVSCELSELELSNAVEGHRFRTFLAPIGGRFGPQQHIAQMAERVRFASVEDYQNYFKRLALVPKLVDETIALLRLGMQEGRTPPRVTLIGVPSQFKALVDGGGLSALRDPLMRMPEHIAPAARTDLAARFDADVFPQVRDAVARLGEFFEREYLPACRESTAAADWPDGQAYYEHQLRVMTTLDFSANQIHEIGLREVARIRAEMMQVIRRSDYHTTEHYRLFQARHESALPGDDALFAAFIDYLRTDPRFYHTSERDLVRAYRDICKQVDGALPRLFKILPRLPYGVKEIPRFMAPQQTTAYYQGGNINNAEAGWFMANTYALDQRPKYEMIPLALHEAVPGHHLQIALAQELESLPEFRRNAYFIAYGEGWALYAESLGKEIGLYGEPYDDFGRLLYEMWRACRLVVDPGMHALGWTRDRAIQFMRENTALSELNIANEIDRYIAWPGQATAYKLGELKIRELRAKAEKALGARFDIREFHEVILGAGSVPLGVLDRRVDQWLQNALKRSAAPKSGGADQNPPATN